MGICDGGDKREQTNTCGEKSSYSFGNDRAFRIEQKKNALLDKAGRSAFYGKVQRTKIDNQRRIYTLS